MGQRLSKWRLRRTAANEGSDHPGNQTREQDEHPIPTPPSTPPKGESQEKDPHSRTRMNERGPFLSTKPSHGCDMAPSSHSHDESTLEGSPSTCRKTWSHRGSFNHISGDHPSLEREHSEGVSPLTGVPVFQRHFKESALKICCPKLIGVLRDMCGFPDVAFGKNDGLSLTPVINEPYESIFHNKDEIEKVARGSADEHTKQHVQLLLNFIEQNYPLTCEKLGEIKERRCQKIAFEDLWLIYSHGSTVFSKEDGAWRAFKVDRVEISPYSGSKSVLVHCCYLDFDKTGTRLVPCLKVFHVSPFSSERPVESLEVVPDWCLNNREIICRRLIERGKKFWSYNGRVLYRAYCGDAWPRASQDDGINVIVDYVTSSKHDRDTGSVADYFGQTCHVCLGKSIQLTPFPTKGLHDPDLCTKGSARTTYVKGKGFDDDALLMYCSPKVWAFSVWHGSWELVFPEELREVQRESDSFEKLQMKSTKKVYLDSIVHGYLGGISNRSNVDLIKGKGKGINVLLYGGPGTGKTLTVESLAKKHGIPLYMITCDKLGDNSEVIEERLGKALLRATNWNIILLLDEADVLWRSEIVATFLRHLDYSQAMVFMTTHWGHDQDSALQSRVHMKIHLPNFTFDIQKVIWNNSIDRFEGLRPDHKNELQHFITYELENLDDGYYTKMNGRQIRNCLSAASALARGKTNTGSFNHLDVKTVLRLGKEYKTIVSQSGITPTNERMQDMLRGFEHSIK